MDLSIANIRPALRDLALKLELPALWRWWVDELAPMMPMAPRAALKRRRLRPVLAFGTDAAVLWDPRVDNGTLALAEVAAIPLSGDAAAIAHAGRTAIAALPARALSGVVAAPKIIVALSSAQVLRKHIVLPAAVEENLIETLAYDLDRHTPFRSDQLYFDATVVGRDMAKKEIRVDWAAALKTVVDSARRQAESWGAAVIGVTPEALTPGSGAVVSPSAWSKLNLLPQDERPYATSWRRWQFWVPISLVAIMAFVAVALPLWQKREFAIELSAVTDQARLKAAAADALRQQLDQATGDYNFALSKKYAYPGAMQLLDDVTRLMPDDTWLTQFEVKNVPKGKEPHREMLLRGETANAGRLISALEDSKEFEQTAPRSPTTKIQPGPGEVFDLGSQVIPLPSPTLVALVVPAKRPTGAGAESAHAGTGQPSTGTSAGAAVDVLRIRRGQVHKAHRRPHPRRPRRHRGQGASPRRGRRHHGWTRRHRNDGDGAGGEAETQSAQRTMAQPAAARAAARAAQLKAIQNTTNGGTDQNEPLQMPRQPNVPGAPPSAAPTNGTAPPGTAPPAAGSTTPARSSAGNQGSDSGTGTGARKP